MPKEWSTWARINGIPEKELEKWRSNQNRIFHCIFCGTHGKEEKFQNLLISDCPKCHEYKGIEPCIPNHCPCDEEWNV